MPPATEEPSDLHDRIRAPLHEPVQSAKESSVILSRAAVKNPGVSSNPHAASSFSHHAPPINPYQGTASAVPKSPDKKEGFSPCDPSATAHTARPSMRHSEPRSGEESRRLIEPPRRLQFLPPCPTYTGTTSAPEDTGPAYPF